MEHIYLVIAALIPFVLIFYLMIIKKWAAIKVMPLTWVVTVLLVLFIWKISFVWAIASFFRGILLAIEIGLIIFGAVWLLEIYKESKAILSIQSFLVSISPDIRIQAIIIAWLFASLIEGVAGFGTPVALAAPLLVSIGFTPIASVVISLIGNSAPVSFGAAGTPILLGLGSLGFKEEVLREVATNSALMHLIAGSFVPIVIVYFITHFMVDKKDRNSRSFYKIIPFALFSGLSFTIPYYFIAAYVGMELPSIGGGVIGLLFVGFAAKFGFLVPKEKITFKHHKKLKIVRKRRIFVSIIPYLIIIIGLLVSRVVLSVKEKLNSFYLGFDSLLGLDYSYNLAVFYTPSFYFILAGIVALFLFGVNAKTRNKTVKETLGKIKKPIIALIFALALVQLLLISGNNIFGIGSIPLILANSLADLTGKNYVIIAPFVGLLGAFIAGSNTVSNLLFGSFQGQIAISLGISVALVLALQTVGGAIGNMIAIHNVLAASATVGLHGEEGRIIRKTIIVSLGYALIVGIIGFLFVLFS
ncbi:L-lactate permease [Candidatus Pacearchaeota archaeon]|nr:L-lactate permease [Candidatus Pacearchaeota archaeon]